MSEADSGADGDDYVGSTLDDFIYSDVSRLEIDLSLPAEDDIDRNICKIAFFV